jgi:hypothetical protein
VVTTALLVVAGIVGPAIVVLLVLFLLGSFVAALADGDGVGVVRPNPS